MKWLIYGANGWIGGQITKILNNEQVIPATSRANNPDDVERELIDTKPDRVICLIGRTHGGGMTTIDYLQTHENLFINLRDNLYGPMVLAMLCKKNQIHLTYMGTGCIFTYDNPAQPDMAQQFTERSTPNFFDSNYSTVKGVTDQLMHLLDDTVLNIRIRMPITSDNSSRNLITKLINYEKICSIPNSMSVLPTLLPLMLDMARDKRTGTINLVNPGVITHNEILDMYREIVNPTFKYENFTLHEQEQILKAGRSNNCLDTSKLEKMYPDVPDIHTAVRQIMYEIIRNESCWAVIL